MANYSENNQFLNRAKAAAVQAFNSSSFANTIADLDVSQVYIVWFCKTLQNWKALVSTDAISGIYIEVTYDGDAEQSYIDIYSNVSNSTIPDVNLNM